MSARGHHGVLLAAGSGGDPYWANVTSLLPLDTDIFDLRNHSWVAAGTTGIVAASGPFGGGCLRSAANGSNNFTCTVSPPMPGGGDFTLEAWCYVRTASVGRAMLIDTFPEGATSGAMLFVSVETDTSISLVLTPSSTNRSAPNLFTLNAWHFIRVARSQGVTRLAYDGVTIFAVNDSTNYSSSALSLLRDTYNHRGTDGDMSNFRLTVGVARDLSEVPTAPFPNHA